MDEFHEPIQHAHRQAIAQGVHDATLLVLDLRDERAQKMAAAVADLNTVRDVAAAAERSMITPVLVAYMTCQRAAVLLKGYSKKAKQKFTIKFPADRFRMVVVGSGGITWAVGAIDAVDPNGAAKL
jgi:hypothetical protein